MGGMLLLGFLGSIILWCDWFSSYVSFCVCTFLYLGFLDNKCAIPIIYHPF
ncbi:hypothetical protein K737_300689 [Holospora undulata HU1]|uniref:Uncharacterized protein n=1 Tax=Holospora undulata HU1 TaxID=1321371 RepID=A0A061JIJ7_9PROT|nr:hypothetical protein K737_300689 [Holospora undulata HU1]